MIANSLFSINGNLDIKLVENERNFRFMISIHFHIKSNTQF